MRFFLDENMPQGMIAHLSSVFKPHEFVGVRELRVKGVEDVELFGRVAAADCHVFITADLAQLTRAAEREACRVAELHWIGVHQVHAPGFHVIAGPTSTLVHALPFALEHMESSSTPQYFKLRKSERANTRIFHSSGYL
ncbi:hypothetical protein D5S18_07580 [Nocardia panacis]|uniref:VapC45 PIN like domain-containing protein n=1 Tax=Nocardia panacis TaxID=2340916 RepID=A0A3A4KVR4_9NOCA|nr:hypothetical protein [Nocardia panacis]RJO77594.1 hypothetical protein D5S18_07580 [Nocardia panacis]